MNNEIILTLVYRGAVALFLSDLVPNRRTWDNVIIIKNYNILWCLIGCILFNLLCQIDKQFGTNMPQLQIKYKRKNENNNIFIFIDYRDVYSYQCRLQVSLYPLQYIYFHFLFY